jgi:hypothetical protein
VLYLAPDRIELASAKLGQVAADTVERAAVPPGSAGNGCNMTDPLAALSAAWPTEMQTDHGDTSLHAVVSNRYVRWQTLPWSDALLKRKSSEAQHRFQFATVWGETGADAAVYAAADAPYGLPRVVMSMDGAAVDHLKSLVREQGATLVSLRPMIVAAWDAMRHRIAEKVYAFCTVEQDSLTLAVIRGGRMQAVVTHAWSGDWVVALELFWRRQVLRDTSLSGIGALYTLNLTEPMIAANLPKDGVIALLDVPGMAVTNKNTTPAALILAAAPRRKTLDFVTQPVRFNGWRLALLAASVLLASLALWQVWHYQIYTEGFQRELAQSTVFVQPLARTRSASERRELDARILTVNEAIGQLNLPVTALLRAIQPPRDVRVALLGMDVTGRDAGMLKISAEARTGQEMATYVAYLAEKKLFGTVYLTKHEIAEHDAERPFRFTLEATWRE